ncbi:MAG: OB-fold nucleic acid binding domain-containing protein, partial [Lachnospiraceae bacterium]|nr:OB-fold nucleic acid binding domain-containing protein [Lachnospiraceae bacterium]
KVVNDKKSAISGQMSLFDLAGADQKSDFMIRVPDVGEFDKSILLDFEKDVTGIYISGHPLDEYSDVLNRSVTARSSDFAIDDEGHVIVRDGSKAVIGGLIASVTKKSARNGQPMAFLTLEDLLGSVEVIVFPKDYAVFRPLIEEGRKVIIKGRVSVDSDADGKLICESMQELEGVGRELWFQFRDMDDYMESARYIESLSSVEQLKGGNTVIKIYLKKEKQLKVMDSRYNINLTEDFLNVLKKRFGEENVKVTTPKK